MAEPKITREDHGNRGRYVARVDGIDAEAQLVWNRHGPAAAAGVIVFDRDFDARQMFSYRCLEVGQADRLKAHIGIVKVLYRRLNQYYFQIVKVISDRLTRRKVRGRLCPAYSNPYRSFC